MTLVWQAATARNGDITIWRLMQTRLRPAPIDVAMHRLVGDATGWYVSSRALGIDRTHLADNLDVDAAKMLAVDHVRGVIAAQLERLQDAAAAIKASFGP